METPNEASGLANGCLMGRGLYVGNRNARKNSLKHSPAIKRVSELFFSQTFLPPSFVEWHRVWPRGRTFLLNYKITKIRNRNSKLLTIIKEWKCPLSILTGKAVSPKRQLFCLVVSTITKIKQRIIIWKVFVVAGIKIWFVAERSPSFSKKLCGLNSHEADSN